MSAALDKLGLPGCVTGLAPLGGHVHMVKLVPGPPPRRAI
jgi:hypothetical protein